MLAYLLNFKDDLFSLLEHQYDTSFSRHPYPICWFLFLPSHEDHNLFQHINIAYSSAATTCFTLSSFLHWFPQNQGVN